MRGSACSGKLEKEKLVSVYQESWRDKVSAALCTMAGVWQSRCFGARTDLPGVGVRALGIEA